MRARKFRVGLIAGASAILMGLTGCAGGGAAGTDDGDTVPIDVGNDLTVNLRTSDDIKIAVFLSNTSDAYGAAETQAIEDVKSELGLDITVYDAAHDPATQLTQMQTALQSGQYDAAVLEATDGNVMCKISTEEFPEANVVLVAQANPLCERGANQTGESVEEVWAPGTLNFTGSNNTRAYIDGWFSAVAKANPGRQKIAAVIGLQVAVQTRVIESAMKKFAEENPDYEINTIYTDFSTPDAFNKTQTHLQGHPDTTVVLSSYTPDMSKGVVQAVEQAGLLGKVKIIDQGFGGYSLEQIEEENIQFSTLFFPYNMMRKSLESIVNAQKGDRGPRFVDDSAIGTAENPFIVTKETISELPAELRK